MQLNHIRSGAVIIVGSGMCNGGRIKTTSNTMSGVRTATSDHRLPGTGYVGATLVARHIRLWGKTIRVAAVHTVGSLSAHADQDGLLKWYSSSRIARLLYWCMGRSRLPLVCLSACRRDWEPRYGWRGRERL